MDIKNLAELVKNKQLMIFSTAHKGTMTGRIVRADVQAKTVTIMAEHDDVVVVEASDILTIKPLE